MKTFLNLLTGLTLLAVSASAISAQTATLVEDIDTRDEEPGPGRLSYPLHPFGERLLFMVRDATSGNEPWITDGSVSGTRMLADTCQGSCDHFGQRILGTLQGRLLWYDSDRIWSTDGTPGGTDPLTPTDLSIPDLNGVPDAALAGGHLYFQGCLEEEFEVVCSLWQSDGTPAGTRTVPLPDANNGDLWIDELTGGADRLYFVRGFELWWADASGAHRVAELPASRPVELWTTWDNRVFFVLQNEEKHELWVSDGTAEGTRSLASFAGERIAWLTTGSRGLYFVADDILHGEEIWNSDGTPQGTRRITQFGTYAPFYLFDFDQGDEGWAFELGDRLLFAATDRLTGQRLWSTTGTPESTRAASEPSVTSRLLRAGDRVFFFRHRQDNQTCEVWSFDGRGTGNRVAENLDEGVCAPGSYYENFVLRAAGNLAYFVAQDAKGTWGIWRSDGSRNGTTRVVSMPEQIFSLVGTAGRRVYFGTLTGLWVWDQTAGLRQIVGSGIRNRSSLPLELGEQAGKLLFSACDDTSREIWSSQGSAADTVPLTRMGEINCFEPLEITPSGSSLFFLRSVHSFSSEVWKTDASGGAPVQLTPPIDGEVGLFAFQGGVWFRGPESEIWKSDGSPAGTGPAVSVPEGKLYAGSSLIGAVDGNFLYFVAYQEGQQALWRTDGTSAGTVRLMPLSFTSDLELARLGSHLYLAAEAGLWRTDGTPAGTVRLTRERGGDLLAYPSRLVTHGGALYAYAAEDAFGGRGLWRTDGTPAGTWLVAPLEENLFSQDIVISRPVRLGGRLLFVASDEEHGAELWATDGTPAGTALVADLSPGSDSSYPAHFVVAGGEVWFTAHDPLHGRELWRTDGTAAGTRLAQDIAPEGLSSSPDQLTVVGDRLFFSADDALTGRELWVLPLNATGGCRPSDTALCLRGGRFRVEARWQDFQGHRGVGRAVPLTADTGTFWFFEPSNTEVLLKVLDGRGLNDHQWVFYGALSSVEYSLTVTDTETGFARRYLNPSGQLASAGDTEAFGPRGSHSPNPDLFVAPPSPGLVAELVSARTEPATGDCRPGPRRLCLNDGRFAVEASWKDFAGRTGQGTAVPFTNDTGYFWFFDPANVEVMLKVLDGTPLNGKFWVFYGALSNVEYTLKVTDTKTGAVKEYRNPSGRFSSVGDTGAF